MARIRTIKPEFFKDFDLYKAEKDSKLPLRVAYAGLWTASDKEGRFKWKPEELKLDCLPYDPIDDFSRVLDALWSRGFIEKYTHEGKTYGFIPSWTDHQHINNRETDSVLPIPIESNICTCEARVNDASGTRQRNYTGERKGKERNTRHDASREFTFLPDDFKISDRVKKWAQDRNQNHLQEHFDSFILKCKSKKYKYADWDAAFMNAIRDNWANINNSSPQEEKKSWI
jgi:hypothetical protein